MSNSELMYFIVGGLLGGLIVGQQYEAAGFLIASAVVFNRVLADDRQVKIKQEQALATLDRLIAELAKRQQPTMQEEYRGEIVDI